MPRLPTRALTLALAAALGGCAGALGAPDPIATSTVGVRVDQTTSAAELAAALNRADADYALVAAPQDAAWFLDVAGAAGLELSGPGSADGLNLAFLGPEAVGDTTLRLDYDGGSFVVHDALYEMPDERYLDLLAFRVERADLARPMVAALLEYVATDVMPASAVVLAVAVPSDAVGDSVARMLSPGYFDAFRCGDVDAPADAGLRMFHGPEARIRCRGARLTGGPGAWIHATLDVGRP